MSSEETQNNCLTPRRLIPAPIAETDKAGRRLLVIGYGNPLRGDDGLGWRAAEEAARAMPDAEVVICNELAYDLSHDVAGASLVVFVDASAEGDPGEVRCEQLKPSSECPAPFTHHIEPVELLALARGLYGVCPPSYRITVTGTRFEPREGLSDAVTAALPKVLWHIRQIVGECAMLDEPAE